MSPARQKTGPKRCIWLLVLALLPLAACAPDKKAEEELRREIQGLKTEIKALQDKVAQLEANQAVQDRLARLEAATQEILKEVAKPAPPPGPAAPPPPLTIGQLLKEKEKYQGSRVTIQGMPGTVLVHHKTMLLKAPEGVVEVYYGALPDIKAINRLSSTILELPLTFTGTVNFPTKTGGHPRITAEAVEF